MVLKHKIAKRTLPWDRIVVKVNHVQSNPRYYADSQLVLNLLTTRSIISKSHVASLPLQYIVEVTSFCAVMDTLVDQENIYIA